MLEQKIEIQADALAPAGGGAVKLQALRGKARTQFAGTAYIRVHLYY